MTKPAKRPHIRRATTPPSPEAWLAVVHFGRNRFRFVGLTDTFDEVAKISRKVKLKGKEKLGAFPVARALKDKISRDPSHALRGTFGLNDLDQAQAIHKRAHLTDP